MVWLFALITVWMYGLYLAGRVIHEGRTSQGSLSWVIVFVFIAPVAVPLFWLFGDRRLDGYIRARRTGRERLDATFRQMLAAVQPAVIELHEPGLRVFAELAKLPWTRGNRVELFSRATKMYDSMVGAIDEAQHTVLMQFYIYRDDEVGQRVREALVRALSRSVSVHLMYDELGCASLPKAFFDPLTQAGGHVSGFRTVPRKRKLLRLNFRNHRKLTVIDAKTVYFGGMNVGREYCGDDESIGEWRDTHARASGALALAGQMIFVEDWHWAQQQIPTQLQWPSVVPLATGHDSHVVQAAMLFPSGPAGDQDAGQLMFLQLISNASKRLWIATPYFVCDEAILDAIVLAKRRGVDVRILVPATPDSLMIKHATKSFLSQMLQLGIEVYQYERGFTHQKVLLCDNVATIGSANLDHRSMRLNFELTGIMADEQFAQTVAIMLERDMTRASRMPANWWSALTSVQRFTARAARLAAPLL